jgi:hypothetical protein
LRGAAGSTCWSRTITTRPRGRRRPWRSSTPCARTASIRSGADRAGVAWKVAHLLIGELGGEAWRGRERRAAASGAGRALPLPELVRELADLALIGTVADVAPILGENRSIARLGLEQLRIGARPGLAALLERAGVARDRLDLDDIGFAIAPRLNAAGRVGRRPGRRCSWPATGRGGGTGRGDRDGEPGPARDHEATRSREARHELGLGPARAAPTCPRMTASPTAEAPPPPAPTSPPRCSSAGSGRSASSA